MKESLNDFIGQWVKVSTINSIISGVLKKVTDDGVFIQTDLYSEDFVPRPNINSIKIE